MRAEESAISDFPDSIIQRFISNNKNQDTEKMTDIGYFFGTGKILYIGFSSTALLTSFKTSSFLKKIQQVSILSLESLLLSGTVTLLLKWTFHRHRPSEEKSPLVFDGPSLHQNFLSFPSGHSSNSWAWATIVSSSYESLPLSIACYTIASMSSFARVAANKHWTTDVIAGAFIGFYSAKYILKINGKKNKKTFDAFITPVHGPKTKEISGIQISLRRSF